MSRVALARRSALCELGVAGPARCVRAAAEAARRVHMADTSAAEAGAYRWLRATQSGYCAVTDGPGDCEAGDRGSWSLLPFSGQTHWAIAADTCLRRCAKCRRCRWISLSVRFADCSWYAECGELQADLKWGRYVRGFRTAAANASLPTSIREYASTLDTARHVAHGFRAYDASKMYDASGAFRSSAGFLRGFPPRVLTPDWIKPLLLPPGELAAATASISPFGTVGVFNPSALVPAPAGLCGRCAHLVLLRVDALHQCDGTSPYRDLDVSPINWRATAIAALDEEFRTLAWTWLIVRPDLQTNPSIAESVTVSARLTVSKRSSGAFEPPMRRPFAYDARLLAAEGELFVSYSCHDCAGFTLAQIRVEGRARGGGLARMRAFVKDGTTVESRDPTIAGRNQALFVGPSSFQSAAAGPVAGRTGGRGRVARRAGRERPAPALLLQPWLSLIYKQPEYPYAEWVLAHNHSKAWHAATCHLGERRASPTANLISSPPLLPGMLLGIAHVYRGRGSEKTEGAAQWDPHAMRGWKNFKPPFQFGYDYTHFFYSLSSKPPHQLLATSAEFCLSAVAANGSLDSRDCESIQFISGLRLRVPSARAARRSAKTGQPEVLLSFGVNDCEARVAAVPLATVQQMLVPVAAPAAACPSPPPPSRTSLIDDWLEAGSNGYCGETTPGGDCQSGEKGSIPLNREEEVRTWWHATATCMGHCARCANCHFMTVSLRYKDCSWYRTCDLEKLGTKIQGFRSGAFARVAPSAVPPLRTYKPRMTWRSFDVPQDGRALPFWGPRMLHNCWVVGRLGELERVPKLALDNMRSSAPGFTHRIHSDTECVATLGAYGDRFARAFTALRRGAHKADLCKYAIMFRDGGVYIDIDAKPLRTLPEIFARPNVLTTVLSIFNGSVNQGIIATPQGHPLLRDAFESAAAIRRAGPLGDGAYLDYTYDFYRLMVEDVGAPLVEGLNKNRRRPGFDYYLLRERCTKDAAICDGKLDLKLGLCCAIYDGNTPVFLQRDFRYPFEYPW